MKMAGRQTSSALSNRPVNSATTILICSLPGTYAFPALKNTLLPSTNSGTRSQSTLNQLSPSNLSPFKNPPAAALNSSLHLPFSSSPTTSHSRLKPSTKACRSLTSLSRNRNRNSILSTRLNLLLKSSVLANASRSIKCE